MTKRFVLAIVFLLPVGAYAEEYLDEAVQDFTLPNDVYCVVYEGPVIGNTNGTTPSVTMQCDFGRRKYSKDGKVEKATEASEADN